MKNRQYHLDIWAQASASAGQEVTLAAALQEVFRAGLAEVDPTITRHLVRYELLEIRRLRGIQPPKRPKDTAGSSDGSSSDPGGVPAQPPPGETDRPGDQAATELPPQPPQGPPLPPAGF